MLKINFKDKEEGGEGGMRGAAPVDEYRFTDLVSEHTGQVGEGEGDCGMAQQKQVLRTSLI